MDKEYLTVKEFSIKADVTVQSVYQRLETTLKPYLKVVKGKKYIDTKALEKVYNIDLEQGFKGNIKDLEQDFKGTNDTIKELQDKINSLNQQLEQKDQEIKDFKQDIQDIKQDFKEEIKDIKQGFQVQIDYLKKDKEFLQDQLLKKDTYIKSLEDKNSTIDLLSKNQPIAIETVEPQTKEPLISKWRRLFNK